MTGRRMWSPQMEAELVRLYPSLSAPDIASRMGLQTKQIQYKAHKLGLKKSPEWIAERARRAMADPSHPAHQTRFRRGNVPANKGKPHPAKGRSIETQFRAGNRPHSWHPIGYTRISKDGYRQRKTADTGVTRRDYVGLHHLVWRMHGGTIPASHALCFIDGDPENLDINNLELVSRAELMARNTVHRLPKDVALAVQMIGALRRQINKREEATA